MKYLILAFVYWTALAVSANDVYLRCNSCSDLQMLAAAQNEAYRLHMPRCTLRSPCTPQPKDGPVTSISSGDEVEIYYWNFYVHDFSNGRSRHIYVDTYKGSSTLANPSPPIQRQLSEAQKFYDYFKLNMSAASAAAIDLGSSFPVGSVFDLVGNTPNMDRVRNVIAGIIENAGPAESILQLIPSVAIQRLVTTQLQNAILYYNVTFPDGSTAVIKITVLPTIDAFKYIYVASILTGSLRDSDGNLVPDDISQMNNLVQRYGTVRAGSNFENFANLINRSFGITLVGSGSTGSAKYSCKTSSDSNGGVTVSCMVIP